MVEPVSATFALGNDAANAAADDDDDDGADREWSIAPARHDGTHGRIRSRLSERRVLRFAGADRDVIPGAKQNRTGTSDDAGGDSSLDRIAVAADAATAAVPTRWDESRTSRHSVRRAVPGTVHTGCIRLLWLWMRYRPRLCQGLCAPTTSATATGMSATLAMRLTVSTWN